jgi:hypothetical protein
MITFELPPPSRSTALQPKISRPDNANAALDARHRRFTMNLPACWKWQWETDLQRMTRRRPGPSSPSSEARFAPALSSRYLAVIKASQRSHRGKAGGSSAIELVALQPRESHMSFWCTLPAMERPPDPGVGGALASPTRLEAKAAKTARSRFTGANVLSNLDFDLGGPSP